MGLQWPAKSPDHSSLGPWRTYDVSPSRYNSPRPTLSKRPPALCVPLAEDGGMQGAVPGLSLGVPVAGRLGLVPENSAADGPRILWPHALPVVVRHSLGHSRVGIGVYRVNAAPPAVGPRRRVL